MTFHLSLNETTGSIGERQATKQGDNTESTGSVGYQTPLVSNRVNISHTLSRDTVSFQGYSNYDSGHSASELAFGVASVAALAIIGLGYAHKHNTFSNIGNENVKQFLNKISEPCHKICSKTLNFVKENYEKIKNSIKR